MRNRTGSPLLPDRLPAISDRWHARLRPAWFALLAVTILLDLAGTIFVLRDAYRNDPAFARLGLVSQFEDDGSVTVAPSLVRAAGTDDVPTGARILAIDGVPVARETRVWTLAALLDRREGARVELSLLAPDGHRLMKTVHASARYARIADAGAVLKRDVRIAMRMAISLATCLVLIGSAALLYLRRSRDPVAVLLSLAFLIFAGSIDPPLLMWMGLGTGLVYDLYSTTGWVLLVIGLAAFPDGSFLPRFVRWIVPGAPLMALPLMIEAVPLPVMTTIAFVLPLGLLLCHAAKYRRYPEGIQRQQVKWAAFGFAAGLALLSVTFYLAGIVPETSPWDPLYGLAILILFNLGFLSMAGGLLVSLLRFRLWEADRVIGRSTVAAGITLAVGIVWTLSSDLVKAGVQFTLGEGHAVVATAAGALLAAGLFAPSQALALRWTEGRFNQERERLDQLEARISVWRTTEPPEEIALRTLSALAGILHASVSAIVADTHRGRVVLATWGEAAGHDLRDDDRYVLAQALEDDEGPLGRLLVGPRSDLNRYNAGQIACVQDIARPLAEALRAAMKRSQQADAVHHMLGEMKERLARLEGGPGLPPSALA